MPCLQNGNALCICWTLQNKFIYFTVLCEMDVILFGIYYLLVYNHHHHHHLFLKRPFFHAKLGLDVCPKLQVPPHIPKKAAHSGCKPSSFMSSLTHCSHSLPTPSPRSRPLHHQPSASRHPIFHNSYVPDVQTMLNLPRPHHISNTINTKLGCINPALRFLSFKDTPHIHLTIIRSVLSFPWILNLIEKYNLKVHFPGPLTLLWTYSLFSSAFATIDVYRKMWKKHQSFLAVKTSTLKASVCQNVEKMLEVYIYIYIYIYDIYIYIHIYICHICISYLYIYRHICIPMIYIYIYIYIYIFISAYIIYIYIYIIYIFISIHIYIYIQSAPRICITLSCIFSIAFRFLSVPIF